MNDGGPAFGKAGYSNSQYPGLNEHPQSGMSLRDYFAAKAPPVPDWFNPNPDATWDIPPMPEFPPLLEICGLPVKWFEYCENFYQTATGIAPTRTSVRRPDGVAPDAVDKFLKSCSEYELGYRKVMLAFEECKFIKWRWHYADAMLAERAKVQA